MGRIDIHSLHSLHSLRPTYKTCTWCLRSYYTHRTAPHRTTCHTTPHRTTCHTIYTTPHHVTLHRTTPHTPGFVRKTDTRVCVRTHLPSIVSGCFRKSEGLTVNLLPATFRVTLFPEGDVDSLEVAVAPPLTLPSLELPLSGSESSKEPSITLGCARNQRSSWDDARSSCRQSGHCFPGHTANAYIDTEL